MNGRTRPIATSMMIAILATGLFPATYAWSAESSEVKELLREVSQLRAETQVLQAALAEAAELERQRSAKLLRALSADAASPQAAAPPPAPAPPSVAVTETRSPTIQSAPSSGGVEKRRSKSRHRRHRRDR